MASLASSSSSSAQPLARPSRFRYIYVNLPPMLRLVHNSMLYKLEDIILSVNHETELRDKEQKQARANDLFLEARKLCVDPKLSKSIINLCRVNPSLRLFMVGFFLSFFCNLISFCCLNQYSFLF
jgi:hypothetical protein